MRALRSSLPQDARIHAATVAAAWFEKFADSHPAFRSIACYLSHGDELPTGPILDICWRHGLRVAVPAWEGCSYRFAWLSDGTSLEKGPMGIAQPTAPVFAAVAEIDLFLVPGLVFSTDGGRIGYGGGWYDRLLSGRRNDSLCVGYCLDLQLVDEPLPMEPHDLRMAAVLTPTRLRPCIVPQTCVTSSSRGAPS